MKTSESPIIISQIFDNSAKSLWKVLTERDEMIQWFFENIPDFEPKVGFETSFIVENECRIFRHCWKIIEVDTYKKISYNWKYEGYAGDSNVTFELEELDGKTHLTLTHEVIEDFPADIPEFRRESCQGGWEYFINERLRTMMMHKE